MRVSNDNRSPELSERIRLLSEVVSHRCARTTSERDASNLLRSHADARGGSPRNSADDRRRDKALDDCPNAWVTTTFIMSALASTLRVHVADRVGDYLPSLDLFADILNPLLREGRTIVEPSRTATELQFSQDMSEMPYIALRPAWLAAEYFDAAFLVTTAFEEHRAFYQRAFGYEKWSAPRACSRSNRNVICLGLPLSRARERVEARFPYLRSSQAERDVLYGHRTTPRAAKGGGLMARPLITAKSSP